MLWGYAGEMPKRISDPIDRIVGMVFDAQGDMTLNELCLPGIRDFIAQKVSEGITAEFEDWHNATCEITRLEEQSARE